MTRTREENAADLAYEVAAMPPHEVVWTVTIETKYGTDTTVFRSEQGALDSLAAWARDWWPQEVAGWNDPELPTQAEFDALTDSAAIETYFEAVSQFEWYTIDSTPLLD